MARAHNRLQRCKGSVAVLHAGRGMRLHSVYTNQVGHHRPEEDFIKDLRAKQQNVVWPDPVVNASRVDKFLWRGSLNPTWVQRVGAWIVGMTFMGSGLVFLLLASQAWHQDAVEAITFGGFGTGLLSVGIKMFLNGWPKRR